MCGNTSFPKELECAPEALRVFSGRPLKGEVDDPSADFLAAPLHLLHDRIWTADEYRGQGSIP